MKKWIPLVLTILGFVGLGSLAVYRLIHVDDPWRQACMGLAFAIYVAWMLWESRVSVQELGRPERDHDRGTMELCAAVKIGLLVAALAGGAPEMDRALALVLDGVALALLISGIWLRSSAIRTLGSQYTHRIRTPELPLTTHGPYAWLRHPAYAGTLLIHAGVVLLLPNGYALAALAAWFLSVWYRTRIEDAWLRLLPDYQSYSARVPGMWLPRRHRPWVPLRDGDAL